jgi:hypothetical protein
MVGAAVGARGAWGEPLRVGSRTGDRVTFAVAKLGHVRYVSFLLESCGFIYLYLSILR